MGNDEASHFERHDPARNMRRYWRLTITRDLFGTVLLLREWGRIGTAGRSLAEPHADLPAARAAAARLARRKTGRGYVRVG